VEAGTARGRYRRRLSECVKRNGWQFEVALFRLFVNSATAIEWATLAAVCPVFERMTPSGGTMFGVTVFVSDEIPAGTKMILVDADQLAVDPGRVELLQPRQLIFARQQDERWARSDAQSLADQHGRRSC
jgi:hypothetical protein